MQAVIKTGGKQYLVAPGQKIKIEKIDQKTGETIEFTDVLLLADNKEKIKIGQPQVKGAVVKGKVIEQARGKQITVFKYKPKKRYRKKQSSRQAYTEVEITDVSI